MILIEFIVCISVLLLCIRVSLASFENISHVITFDDFDAYKVVIIIILNVCADCSQ